MPTGGWIDFMPPRVKKYNGIARYQGSEAQNRRERPRGRREGGSPARSVVDSPGKVDYIVSIHVEAAGDPVRAECERGERLVRP